MVAFEVAPELESEFDGGLVQCGVVDCRGSFVEVVNEKIADGAAFQVVSVDEHLRGCLPGA